MIAVIVAIVGLVGAGFMALLVMGAAGAAFYLRAKAPASAAADPVVVAEAAPEVHATAAVPIRRDDPTWGAPTAPVTIVIFSDFQCPFCARVAPTLEQLRTEFGPERLRLVFKHNPLPFHQNARPAQEAAVATYLAAGPRGNEAFFRFHDLAFANQQQLTPESYARWAEAAGAEPQRYREALASPQPSAKIDADQALAKQLGVSGVPAFRINGLELVGAQPIEKFRSLVQAELAEAERLVASGTPPERVYLERAAANFQVKPTPPSPTPAAPDLKIWRVPVHPDDPTLGPADALVTIVEISDFECPFCKRLGPTLESVLAKHPTDVRLVWKDNPLAFHKGAAPAAALGRIAFERQGNAGFWRTHAALFALQPTLDATELRTVARDLLVEWSTVEAATTSGRHYDKVAQSQREAAAVAARGTPTCFVNGFRVSGAQPLEKFEEVVREQLTKAQALVAQGTPRGEVYTRIMANAETVAQPSAAP